MRQNLGFTKTESAQGRIFELKLDSINPAQHLYRRRGYTFSERRVFAPWLESFGWRCCNGDLPPSDTNWVSPRVSRLDDRGVLFTEAMQSQSFELVVSLLRDIGYYVRYKSYKGMVLDYGKCLLPGTWKRCNGKVRRGKGSLKPLSVPMAAKREGFL